MGLINWWQLGQGAGIFGLGTGLVLTSPGQGPAAFIGAPLGAVAMGEGLLLIIDALKDEAEKDKTNTCK